MTLKIIIVALLLLIAAVIVFQPQGHPRIEMNQMRAVHSMKQIAEAEKLYAAKHPNFGYACDLSKLSNVSPATERELGLLDQVLSAGQKAGYNFSIANCIIGKDGTVSSYVVTAVPVSQQVGRFAFCSNETAVLFYSESGSVDECLQDRRPWTKGDRLVN